VSEAGVRRTLALYCQLLDDGRYDEWVALFTGDAVLRFGPEPDHHVRGRVAIGEWVRPVMAAVAGRATRHVVLNSVIEVDTDRATAVSDFLLFVQGRERFGVSAVGRYRDTFAADASGWLISEHVATALS